MNLAGAGRPGRHWMFTAWVMPLNPLAWWIQGFSEGRWAACTAAHPGAAEQAWSGPCAGSYGLTGLAALAVLALIPLTATILIGPVIGLVEGRRRYRFAQGRTVCAVIVGITGPPTLAAYALGYAVGRLLPAPRPTAAALAHRDGWDAAVRVYTTLTAGQPLSPVPAPGFLNPEPVYLDAPMTYARYYGMDVTFHPGSTVALGSPAFVAAALIGNLIRNSAAEARAEAMSHAQWREHCIARVVVTASSTWCRTDEGRWLAFDHAAVREYHLDGSTCVMTFAGTEPLLLSGPAAACHAVLFAYLSGDPHWQRLPFLHPIATSSNMQAAFQQRPIPDGGR